MLSASWNKPNGRRLSAYESREELTKNSKYLSLSLCVCVCVCARPERADGRACVEQCCGRRRRLHETTVTKSSRVVDVRTRSSTCCGVTQHLRTRRNIWPETNVLPQWRPMLSVNSNYCVHYSAVGVGKPLDNRYSPPIKYTVSQKLEDVILWYCYGQSSSVVGCIFWHREELTATSESYGDGQN